MSAELPSLSFHKDSSSQLLPTDFSLQEIQEVVFDKRPFLKALIAEQGMHPLNDYAADLMNRLGMPDVGRQHELISTLKRLLAQRLGETVANEVAAQLQKYYVASTADHHGPIGPSFALNSNLLAATGYEKINDSLLKYVLVLSCASISLNHEDFPRGLFFHAFHDGNFELQRLSFLPSNSHSSVVYGFRPYVSAEILKMKKLLQEKVRSGLVDPDQAEVLARLLENVYNRQDVLESSDYCEQMTKGNFQLWKQMFSTENFTVPDLVYLEQETLVSQLLLDYHLEQDTLLHRMIFHPDYHQGLVEPLQKAMNLFLRQGFQPTYLFWGISADKHYRLALNREGNSLITLDGQKFVDLEPEAVLKGLREKTLMPDLLMIFTVLHLYYHLNCLGGFNQMHYLAAMQETYNTLAFDSLPSKANSKLFHYGLRALFLDKSKDVLTTGLDLLFSDQQGRWKVVSQIFQNITLAEALQPSLVEIYRILCPKE